MENPDELQASENVSNVFPKLPSKNSKKYRKRISNNDQIDEEEQESALNTKQKKKKLESDNKLVFSTESITRNESDAVDFDNYYDSSREIQVDYDSRATVTVGWHGPGRGTGNIRISSSIDYQRDVCKDYKETGYCSFGNSCKFDHSREDYKVIEREWEEEEKRKKRNLGKRVDEVVDGSGDGGDDKSEDDCNALPSVCSICGLSFVDPVVIKCKHYFCENCAVKQHLKKKRCFVCDEPTSGIFNSAFELKKKKKNEAEGK